MISVATQFKSRTTSQLRSLNYPRVTGQMDWNATFFFLISPHFLLRCLTWQCYLLSERIPPPRWFTALFQGQTHDWQRVKTPRVDALCCATPSFHLTGTGDRQEIMLSLHPLFFFFHLQHLQWKTQRMCFHSACKATSVVQYFTGREERDCSRTAETRLSVTAVCSDRLSRYLNLRENLSTDPQPEKKRRDPSSDVTVVFISSCALKVAHVMII